MEKCRVALLGLGGAIVVGAGLILIILRKSKKKQQETATEPKPQNAAAKWVELSLCVAAPLYAVFRTSRQTRG